MRFFGFALFVGLVLPLSLHAGVAVTPTTALPGERTTFTLTATADRPSPLIELRLLLPRGITEVSPRVIQGWQIDIVSEGTSVSEIAWSGGSIPPGYQESFGFEATVGSDVSSLSWIVIEKYKDGFLQTYDRSQDEIGTELAYAPVTNVETPPVASDWYGKAALLVASFALVISFASLLRHF